MVLNATFNNIPVISWWSVLWVEETVVPGENHWPAASHWQTLSHNVVSSTPRYERASNSALNVQVVIIIWRYIDTIDIHTNTFVDMCIARNEHRICCHNADLTLAATLVYIYIPSSNFASTDNVTCLFSRCSVFSGWFWHLCGRTMDMVYLANQDCCA